MIRILIILGILFLLGLFIHQLRNHLARDKKREELEDSRLKTDMMDIDKEIAKEDALQKDIAEEIDEIKSQQSNNKKDSE